MPLAADVPPVGALIVFAPAEGRQGLLLPAYQSAAAITARTRHSAQALSGPTAALRRLDRRRHARPSAQTSWARAVASWKSVWTTCAAAFAAAICASPSSMTLPEPFW